MPECAYKNRILNIPLLLNMPKFEIWPNSLCQLYTAL